MLRVTIDPIGSKENLQVPDEVPDDKEHQNDAGHCNDHFAAYRRTNHDGYDSRPRHPNSGGGGGSRLHGWILVSHDEMQSFHNKRPFARRYLLPGFVARVAAR